jgi:hypothetical protein
MFLSELEGRESACTRTGDSEFARVAGKGESKSTNQQADV